MTWRKRAHYLWAAPCTAVGLVFASFLLVAGAQAAWHRGVLEVSWRARVADCGRLARSLHFRGITFGHVILAVSAEELACLRAHERVHVEQYERWGVLFFPAYGLSSLWQLLRGRRPYVDNHFEVQARRAASEQVRH